MTSCASRMAGFHELEAQGTAHDVLNLRNGGGVSLGRGCGEVCLWEREDVHVSSGVALYFHVKG